MRVQRFEWHGGEAAAAPGEGSDRATDRFAREIRSWAAEEAASIDLGPIEAAVAERGDRALAELTATYDATDLTAGPGEGEWQTPDGEPWRIEVPRAARAEALAGIDSELREALETAVANVRAVAEAQPAAEERLVELEQGQQIVLREVPMHAAGIYVPGGTAAYPSSLIMGAVPARVAGVQRIVACSPPGPDGSLPRSVLAAAELCEVDELYAVGGAQAVFAMARGTESIAPVDLIAGPGSARVQEAKRVVFGEVGIDSIAGPSELMVIAGRGVDTDPIALDLCAQAEHGSEGLLVVVSPFGDAIGDILAEVQKLAEEREGIHDAPLALIEVPDHTFAAEVAEAIAPEHLQIDLDREGDAPDLPGPLTRSLAGELTTAGCVFCGPCSATAFGDYAAGSNHVLPTGGAGRFYGPLGPGTFRRRISAVTLPGAAARGLAPHVDRIAREEGLPLHGESALRRAAQAQDDGPEDRNGQGSI